MHQALTREAASDRSKIVISRCANVLWGLWKISQRPRKILLGGEISSGKGKSGAQAWASGWRAGKFKGKEMVVEESGEPEDSEVDSEVGLERRREKVLEEEQKWHRDKGWRY